MIERRATPPPSSVEEEEVQEDDSSWGDESVADQGRRMMEGSLFNRSSFQRKGYFDRSHLSIYWLGSGRTHSVPKYKKYANTLDAENWMAHKKLRFFLQYGAVT